jgi:X-Pro dipeptidyl-peptidase
MAIRVRVRTKRPRGFRAFAAAFLALGLLSGLLVSPTVASTSGPPYEQSEATNYIVKTRHGFMFLEAIHPMDGGKIVKSPTILTITPYSSLGRNGDAAEWVPDGYTRITADVIGTGNSGGCYDYGATREKETGYDVVEWIAKQKWSNGKVAMMGGSYDGTTAIATAVTDPPHLTTIVPQLAISRWYEYAYSGGIRYSFTNEKLGRTGTDSGVLIDEQGFDTPLLFDFGFSTPPPLDPQDPNWQERVESSITPCDELNHIQGGYDLDTPDYNKFWLERDYIKDAKNVDIPVLVTGAWGDWNVKQEESVNFFKAITNSPKRVLFMGSRWQAHSLPGGKYDKVLHQWMDHYLRGVDNGIEKMPEVVSEMANLEGPTKWYEGPWPKTRNIVLTAQCIPAVKPGEWLWRLDPAAPNPTVAQFCGPSQFPSANGNTESHAMHHARSNHDWFWFETMPLGMDVRVFGSIKVQVYSQIDREWVTVTPSIGEMDPACHLQAGPNTTVNPACGTTPMVAITRGWLDSRYRNGLDKAELLKANAPFNMSVLTKPVDFTFTKGHHIGVNIQTEINEWSVPKPYPCQSDACLIYKLLWTEGKTRLVIPVVNGPKDAAHLFMEHHDH